MGLILSKLRRKKTTIEILEHVEMNIKRMESDGRYKEQTHKRVVGYVMAYSLGLYVLFAILYYYMYVGRSQHWLHSLLYASPLLVLPVIVFFIRSTISSYYIWSLNKNKAKLKKLKEEKKKILEEVMNNETYKVAKEILDKYGNPDEESTALKPLLPVKTASNKAIAPAPATPVPIRQRQLALQSPAPLNRSMNLLAFDNTRTPVYKGPRLPPAQLPCHLPERNRSALDKVVDYLTRGGPKYHMALICSGCYSHNGMVLTEEFDYVSYACAYCGRFNPSRKQRPAAPPLQNVRALMPPGNKTSDLDDDSSSEINDSDDEEERREDVPNVENMDVSESDVDRPTSCSEVEPKSTTEKKED